MDKLAVVLGSGGTTEKADEDEEDEELSDEERAMALLEQNAENLVTLAEAMGVESSEITNGAVTERALGQPGDPDESGDRSETTAKSVDDLAGQLG